MLHPVHPFNVDVDIAEQRRKTDAAGKALLTNAEPLLVNLEDSWKLRPEVSCELDNLFVASDYVRTYTNLATMEGAKVPRSSTPCPNGVRMGTTPKATEMKQAHAKPMVSRK
jgi:hypothetical protein